MSGVTWNAGLLGRPSLTATQIWLIPNIKTSRHGIEALVKTDSQGHYFPANGVPALYSDDTIIAHIEMKMYPVSATGVPA